MEPNANFQPAIAGCANRLSNNCISDSSRDKTMRKVLRFSKSKYHKLVRIVGSLLNWHFLGGEPL